MNQGRGKGETPGSEASKEGRAGPWKAEGGVCRKPNAHPSSFRAEGRPGWPVGGQGPHTPRPGWASGRGLLSAPGPCAEDASLSLRGEEAAV